MRAAEAAAAVPGARGGVWRKPLPAAGNSGGQSQSPAATAGPGRVRRRGWAAGGRGPPLGSSGRGAAPRPWSPLGGVPPLAGFKT